jgi:hypothetical protein
LLESDEPLFSEFDTDIDTTVETFGDVIALITEFDGTDGQSNQTTKGPDGAYMTANESQAVVNDSGGALFYKNRSAWELAGVTVAVTGFPNQPDVTRTAMFGNLSYYADVAVYLDQIQSRYRQGDFDGDGQLTAADIDVLTLGELASDHQARFDLDHDGKVNFRDRTIWVEDLKRTYFGDANLDGLFDSHDLVQVLQAGQYEDGGAARSTWATGDWNGDLKFGTGDLVVALQSGGYEQGPRVPGRSSGSVVPEPEGRLLVLLALAVLSSGSRAIRGGRVRFKSVL